MGLDNKVPAGYRKGWRGGSPPAPRAEMYRVRECHLSGRWTVETQLPCINGLSAWVTVADCGKPDPSDQMCGFDPEEWAHRIATALNAPAVS